MGLFCDALLEKSEICLQGIQLVLGMGNKIGFSRKHLPDRGNSSGNPFDAVDNHIIFIAENNIAVFSHDFHDKFFLAKVAHLVQMFYLDMDNTLQTGLGDTCNTSVLQMLAQEHTKIGRSHRTGLVLLSQINEGERSASGNKEALLTVWLFNG